MSQQKPQQAQQQNPFANAIGNSFLDQIRSGGAGIQEGLGQMGSLLQGNANRISGINAANAAAANDMSKFNAQLGFSRDQAAEDALWKRQSTGWGGGGYAGIPGNLQAIADRKAIAAKNAAAAQLRLNPNAAPSIYFDPYRESDASLGAKEFNATAADKRYMFDQQQKLAQAKLDTIMRIFGGGGGAPGLGGTGGGGAPGIGGGSLVPLGGATFAGAGGAPMGGVKIGAPPGMPSLGPYGAPGSVSGLGVNPPPVWGAPQAAAAGQALGQAGGATVPGLAGTPGLKDLLASLTARSQTKLGRAGTQAQAAQDLGASQASADLKNRAWGAMAPIYAGGLDDNLEKLRQATRMLQLLSVGNPLMA